MILGTDIKIVEDYQKTANGDLQLISDIENLREAIYRRLITNPGEVVHRPNYGVGIRKYLNRPATIPNRQELANACKIQIFREKRIESIKEVSCDWNNDLCHIMILVTAFNKNVEFNYKVVKI